MKRGNGFWDLSRKKMCWVEAPPPCEGKGTNIFYQEEGIFLRGGEKNKQGWEKMQQIYQCLG